MSKAYTSTPTDHESDCSSYSYCPDFKNYIDEQQLFYIRLHPIIDQNVFHAPQNAIQNENHFRSEYKRMSLRRDRGILSKLTGNKNKSLFDWKILDKSKYEQNDGSKIFKELKIGPAKRAKSKNTKKEENHQKIKGNMFEAIFNGN